MRKNLLILETERSWSHALRIGAAASVARGADAESLADVTPALRAEYLACRLAADLRSGGGASAIVGRADGVQTR